MITTHRSVCPYDCPDTCGLLVDVKDGCAVAVRGDREHPYTNGVICAKMQHYERTVHSPRRLLTPLVRSGTKGSGQFLPISWDDAIAMIVSRWQKIISESGAEAILPYSYAGTMGIAQRNAGHPFFHKLGASRLDRTICSPAKGAGWKAVMGETPSMDPDEALKSDLIILWGINAAATSINFASRVQEAKKRGAKVWLIDTYKTPTAARADRLLLVRPGTDGALALGLMHLLLRKGLIDRQFLAEKVQGFDDFAEKILPEWTPQATAAATGIGQDALEDLADLYGAAQAPLIRLGSGLSRYGNGAMTTRLIACIPALVGAYGKAGGGCFPDTSTGGAFAMGEVTREDLMAKPCRIINMNRLGDALLKLNDPPVKSLYVYHSNPAAVTPDQNAIISGLMREDLFTIVHERFMTDTARFADIILPATSSLEHPDIYRAYGNYCIQRCRQVIPPVGESKPNREVFSLLAAAMGFCEPIFSEGTDEFIDRLLATPAPLRSGTERVPAGNDAALRLSVKVVRGVFNTPSGKLEILNPAEAEPLPRFIPSHGEQSPYPLYLMTAPSLHSLNASFYERDDLRQKQGEMKLMLSPDDAALRGLLDGDMVIAWNDLGEVLFTLEVTDRVPKGVAVAEGVWWLEFAPGTRSVNALVSQRLTDLGGGSTFYDNRIDLKKAG